MANVCMRAVKEQAPVSESTGRSVLAEGTMWYGLTTSLVGRINKCMDSSIVAWRATTYVGASMVTMRTEKKFKFLTARGGVRQSLEAGHENVRMSQN